MPGFRRQHQPPKESSFEGSAGFNVVDDTQRLSKAMVLEDDEMEDPNSCGAFCYDPKTKETLGRTTGSWIRLIGYLLCFVALLTMFWGLCLWVFYQTLDNYTPKLQTTSSFIGNNPGLGFRPMRTDTDPYSSLIWFRHGGDGNWDDLKENLDKFLNEYQPGYWANAGNTQTNCDFERSEPLTENEACEFNLEWLSAEGTDKKCISEELYGYLHGKPCILLKLNRVYGWQPEPYYNLTEIKNHPTMPKGLKLHIQKVWEENCRGRGNEMEQKCPYLNMVWLDCDGEEAPDKEFIGTVTYTPWRGFPGYFFPYWNQLGYLQPVVMVQLRNPMIAVLTNIECTAWAKNIEHDRKNRRGSVHIEFLMD